MVKLHKYIDNVPKIPCNLYEGTRTEYTGQADDGGETTVGVYSAEISKGNLVKIKDHSTNGTILVELAAAGNDKDIAHGVVIDDPIGEDTATATGGTPAAAVQRTATVAFFGQMSFPFLASATGAISPGDMVAMDESEQDEFEVDVDYADITATPTSAYNGSAISLGYAAAGSYVDILFGATFVFQSD
jgi:hypothetical protein